jgi:hypothetical protein
MCPACMASAAIIVAGAGSGGGILAVCIHKFRKFFKANGLFQKTEEKSEDRGEIRWQTSRAI